MVMLCVIFNCLHSASLKKERKKRVKLFIKSQKKKRQNPNQNVQNN